jgi:bla regulator protein BlaR1
MLRLLEHLATPAARPGLIGILEDRRQLKRRMENIAAFAPARRSSAPCCCSRFLPWSA